MDTWSTLLLRFYVAVTTPPQRNEQGDIPGWVMIVVMTAAIVGGLTLVAKPQLQRMLRDALNSVQG